MKQSTQSNGRGWFLLIASLLVAVLSTFTYNNQTTETDSLKSLKLPFAITNNAVTLVNDSNKPKLFSFNGLKQGKQVNSITNQAFSIDLNLGKVKEIHSGPVKSGVLASIAVTIKNRIFVIGGYTVANDHSEKSTPGIFEYFVKKNRYRQVTKMPTPVDDTVALVYKQRFLYLVSGWHDDNNISLMQVYDLENDVWFNATPFPGAPVFGHAGGIVDNRLLIADGVKVNGIVNGKRQYGPSNENWIGEIDSDDPAVIHWQKIETHPFKPLYRMAATGVKRLNRVVFVGGSDNPYNFNGIGYNGVPSEPSAQVFSYSFESNTWDIHNELETASMDHRGLLVGEHSLYVVGGMTKEQRVLDSIAAIPLIELERNRSLEKSNDVKVNP